VCGVVRGDIDTRGDALDDRRVGKTDAASKTRNHTFDEARGVMNTAAGQWLWKWKLMAGVLAIVLAWPGPTILVASTLFGDAYAVLLLSVWIGIGFILQGVAGSPPVPAKAPYPVAAGTSSPASASSSSSSPKSCKRSKRKQAKTAEHTIDEISNRLAARAIHSRRSETAMTMKGRQ
jgi:hypothetical protein